jgi:hypothetical protein
MHKYSLIILFLFYSCSKETIDDNFLCTVDYVEFVNDSSVIVKFDTTLNGVTNSYFGKFNYVQDKNNYFIGDELVNIYDFIQEGNNATFTFEYGENLGFFCATLFETLPEHIHFTFDAEAEKDSTGKSVGRWKIKKRNNLRGGISSGTIN